MKKTIQLLTALFLFIGCNAQNYQITFKVKMVKSDLTQHVTLRGNRAPLSWDKDYVLKDNNGDGTYEATIAFKTSNKNVRFKFLNNGKTELEGADSRILWFKKTPFEKEYTFNEFDFYSKEKIKTLTYTPSQIKEDVAILKEIIQYVHPNIYKYRDSISLQKDLNLLETELLAEPSIENAYKSVSKFAANIKCSHTFTNPWNQGRTIEKAIFYQPNKIPFTFKRIGKRLFIDKDASEKQQLIKGAEILSVNGISSSEIMTRLSQYVTSDGNNYNKKLNRLLVDGAEKFALFDIFYPLEFGAQQKFDLQLKNPLNEETISISVKAISKTHRTAVLKQHYSNLKTSFSDGWKMEFVNNKTARLTINSFAVQEKKFDWKNFLDKAFKEINENKTENLIIDIRGNEGGQGEVGEYILKKLIQQPLQLPAMQSSVRYKKIPEAFKKHINTWDNFPYNFSKKISNEKDGRFILKSKYSIAEKTYQPKKDGFKGLTYLITDATNSSATHLMAMYAKKIDNIILVGQETGGNQKGTNGGFMFFLRLPNTKIEIDIPVIGMQVETATNEVYNGGVVPDVVIQKNTFDYSSNRDTEIEKILELIEQR